MQRFLKSSIILLGLLACASPERQLPNIQREVLTFPNLTGFFDARFNWPIEGDEKIYRLLDHYTGKGLLIDWNRRKKRAKIVKTFYHENLVKEWSESGFFNRIKCLPRNPKHPGQEPLNSMRKFVQFPVGFENWKGLKKYGCGNLTLIQTNRNLNLIKGKLTQKEWNRMGEDIDLSKEGRNNYSKLLEFYKKRAYCTKHARFYGFPSEYKRLKTLQKNGCALTVSWLNETGELKTKNPTHLEAVVQVFEGKKQKQSGAFLATNHYGKLGFLLGGGKKPFEYKPDPLNLFREEPKIYITKICPCSQFDRTLKILIKNLPKEKKLDF